MRVLTILNQKGGVGKTTTTFNLADALSRQGKKILLLDMDPQGHLGSCFGIDNYAISGLDEVLLSGVPIEQELQNVRTGIDLLGAGKRLGEMETKTIEGMKKGYRLHDALAISKNDKNYDFVLIDCPPAAGILAMNAILGTDEMIVPVTGDYLALQGLSRLIRVVKHIETRMNRNTRKWFVMTRFSERRKLAREIRNKMVKYFPGQVLKTCIRENVALAESPGFAKTIFEYSPKSNGACDYSQLAEDFLLEKTF